MFVVEFVKFVGFFLFDNFEGILILLESDEEEEEEFELIDEDDEGDQEGGEVEEFEEGEVEEEEEFVGLCLGVVLFNFVNLDMVFVGDIFFEGNFYGFNIYNVEDLQMLWLLVLIVCFGGQGDVLVVGDLLIMLVEQMCG